VVFQFSEIDESPWDQAAMLLPPAAHPSTSGHGLRIVDAYADDWGWFKVNSSGGKFVWCELGAGATTPQ